MSTRRRRPVSRSSSSGVRPGGGGLAARLANLPAELGALRGVLALLALVTLLFAPGPGTAVVMEGWRMFPTLIVPTLAPLVFMVLMLDALMARVHMTSVRGAALGRYRRIVTIDLVLGLVLIGYWTPYYLAIARP